MSTKYIEESMHSWTDEIVCPYCLYEFSESWEYGGRDNSGEYTGTEVCYECDKEFQWERIITVNYITERILEDYEEEGDQDD